MVRLIECRKRYFEINDILEDRDVRFFVCNEHLRTLIMTERYITPRELNYSKPQYMRSFEYSRRTNADIYHSVVKQLILKEFRLDNFNYFPSYFENDLINKTISFSITKKIIINIPFKTVANIYIENPNNLRIKKRLWDFLNKEVNFQYKKYATKYSFLTKKINKFNKSSREDSQIILLEILNKLLILNTKS